jgi:hypothetical protein
VDSRLFQAALRGGPLLGEGEFHERQRVTGFPARCRFALPMILHPGVLNADTQFI